MTQRLHLTVSAQAKEPPPVPCPFCGQQVRVEHNDRMFDGSLWRCACAAAGLSCTPADLDEASEQFCGALGIHGVSFAEPAVPIGASGHLSVQPYDSPRVLRQLTAFFEGRGARVRFHEAGVRYIFPDGREPIEHTQWFFWIRTGAGA